MVQLPPVLVQYLVDQISAKVGEPAAGGDAAETVRRDCREQVVCVLAALAELNFVPVWAKISTTGRPGPAAWEASISRRADNGGTADAALSALWREEVAYLPVEPPRSSWAGPQ